MDLSPFLYSAINIRQYSSNLRQIGKDFFPFINREITLHPSDCLAELT